jgi:hypothetical protein
LAKPVPRLVDEATLCRLQLAILAEDGDEKQLDGVLRMLGEKTLGKNQLPLFGRASAGQAPQDHRSGP